jgi:hypothetical protein
VAHRRTVALALVLCSVIVASCSPTPKDASSRGTTTPSGWHNGTCSRDCLFKSTPIFGTSTPSAEKAQLAIQNGCQKLPQVKREVLDALDSTDTVAQLKSMIAGAAWKAVSGVGLVAGLSGKYHQFAVDEAVLHGGYAAAISGGPTQALSSALMTFSADCQKEQQRSWQ